MPIVRIHYSGGPLNGTVGNVSLEIPPITTEWAIIYVGDPLIGHYTVNPDRLPRTARADFQATWIPAED